MGVTRRGDGDFYPTFEERREKSKETNSLPLTRRPSIDAPHPLPSEEGWEKLPIPLTVFNRSRATAGGTAVQALVAGTVSDHQGTALKANRSVAVLYIHQSSLDCRLRGM